MPRAASAFAAAAAAFAWAQASSGQPWPSWPAPSPDPLRFGSLAPDLDNPSRGPGQGWEVASVVSTFNTFFVSWQPAAVHSELGRERQPLASDEIRLLEERYPGRPMLFVDVEGWRADLKITGSLHPGLTLTVDVPWVDTTGPHWDALAEGFHRTFGLPDDGRDLFPRGHNALYVSSARRRLERLDDVTGAGLGDVAATIAGALGRALGGEHTWAVSISAPTGEEGTLRGSGGWDAGMRWFGSWRGPRREVAAVLGYTRLDRNGSFLGAERRDTWHAACALRVALGLRTEARVIGRLDGSPLAGFAGTRVAEPGFFLTLGLRRSIGRGWVAFDLGENVPIVGVTPDYSFQVSAGLRGDPKNKSAAPR